MKQQANIQQQLINEHASLICEVVAATGDAKIRAKLLEELKVAEQNGWGKLCSAIRRILEQGAVYMEQLADIGLDVEDEVIVQAIIEGIHQPQTLPQQQAHTNPALAPAGLAGIIHAAARGDENALLLMSRMDDDLHHSQSQELISFAKVIRRLLNGERDQQSLCRGLDSKSSQLVSAILEELKQLA